jgi:Uma2 family endonuclease
MQELESAMVVERASTALRMSVETFDKWVFLPENADHNFECIGGEVIEVVSNSESSEIAMLIGSFITTYVIANNLGRVTGADGGYMIGDERYIPDVAFISRQHQPERSREAYNPIAPDLAVEVISPSDSPALMPVKVSNYLAAHVIVWVVDPDTKSISVHAQGKTVVVYTIDDTLDGGAVLPGFTMALKDVFKE